MVPVPSASAPPAASAAETEDRKVSVGGADRIYRVYVPAGLDRAVPAPLVLWLHGSGGSWASAERTSGLDAQADQLRLIVAYPQGAPPRQTWNAGQGVVDVDDVAFVKVIIDEVAKEHRVDPDRVYVGGLSAGGAMAYRLACEAADRLAAIASVSGGSGPSDCRPARAISVLHLHGTADQQVPYEGGFGTTPVNNKPVVQTNAEWRARDGCPEPTVERSGPLTKTTAAPCRGGTEVTLYTVEGGTHLAPLATATGGTFAASDTPLVVKFLLAQKRSTVP